MSDLLHISPFVVTSAYAGYGMWKSPRARGWSLAVIGSAAKMIFSVFWLEALLFHCHIASLHKKSRELISQPTASQVLISNH